MPGFFAYVILQLMNGAWPQVEFSQPAGLWLLMLLPVVVVFYRRSLVDLPRRQLQASVVVRCLLLLLLILAVSGTTFLHTSSEVFTVFAVDHSLSVDQQAGQQQAQEFIAAATADQSAGSYSVLQFDSTVLPVPSFNDTGWVGEAGSQTDAAQALRFAAAAVPSGFVPHVVLLSDGNETSGDVLSAAAVSDVVVSALPLPTRSEPELQVAEVTAPPQVAEGEPFLLQATINSNHADQVTVDVFSDDILVASEMHDVQPGSTTISFRQQVRQPTEFAVRIRRPEGVSTGDTFQDTLAENNSSGALVFTTGRPKVLMIEREPARARNLEWAMEEEGILIETRPPEGLPQSLSELQDYQVLILSDVPATELSETQMDLIRRYVRDLGGGFMMLGGDESFGLGGYYGSVVEEVLPVRCDFEREKEKPGLGMVLVIDKSGSMGGRKIELTKDAARAAVELLGEKDQIGVIAFDGTPYWVSEVRPSIQKGMVLDRIASITAGGGTTMHPAMEEAFKALQNIEARLKHVIILTDGYSTPGDFQNLTQDMSAAGITVSTVGIGDVDQTLLETIAELGGGRYYFTDDPSAVPQIFAKETIKASKSAVREEPFLPVVVRATSVLQDVNLNEAPFLLGYVATRTKPTSEVILTTESDDPLLAWWRYGLGMSVAFTSDAHSRWAGEWLTWPGYNRFWAQVIRHAMRKSESDGFYMDIQTKGAQRRVVIDAALPDGRFLNEAATELTVVQPDLQTQTLPLQQTAPGRYVGSIEADQPGAWHFQIQQKLNGETIFQQTRGIVVGYPAELRIAQPNRDLLRQLAQTTGGKFDPAPQDVFQPLAGRSAVRVQEIWPWLVSIALALLVVDVFLRRIDVRQLFASGRRRMAER